MKKLLMSLTVVLLTGCTALEHQQSYIQIAREKYPKTAKIMVFEYRNINIRELYDLLYGDYLIIGRSEFNSPYEDPRESVEFAKSIGTDVFVSTSQFKDTQISFIPTVVPVSNATYISGFTGTGYSFGTATSYGTRTTMLPVSFDHYDQNGLYLKNVNHVLPLWERKSAEYKETDANPLSGIWYNESIELKVYKSGNQMVAFFEHAPRNKETGQIGEIKMLFNPDTGVGVYLMPDRTPQPAKIRLNKFGHLEVDLISQNDTYSFTRRKV